jgi:hypothetical protein
MLILLLIIALLLSPAPSFAWTITSGFETGNDGQKAQNSVVGSDALDYAGTLTTITTDAHHSGTKACEIAWPAPVNTTLDTAHSYKWILSGSGTTEYYVLKTDNTVPTALHFAAETQVQRMVVGGGAPIYFNYQHAVGSLAAGEWNIGNNDSLSGNTVYMRLSDGTDPDSKGAGYMVHQLRDSGFNDGMGLTCGGMLTPTSVVTVGQELWSRAYYHFKDPGAGWDWTAIPVVKTMRFGKNKVDDNPQGCISIITAGADTTECGAGIGNPQIDCEYGGGNCASNDDRVQCQSGTPVTFGADQWHCVEMYVKFTNDSTSIMRMWIEGVLEAEKNGGFVASCDAGGYIHTIYFMTYWNGGVPQAQTEYMDDISITTDTPANVDAVGNHMIGPTDWQSGSPGPQMGYGGTISGGAIH